MILNSEAIDYRTIQTKRKKARAGKEALATADKQQDRTNIRTLEQARRYWDSLGDFRKRRRRSRDYHRGRQWSDKIYLPKTREWITEEEHIKRQGKIPFKQNVIRQLMKNLLGQYRNSHTKSIVVSRSKGGDEGAEMLTNAMHHVYDLNYSEEIDARAVEEFALSGCVISKLTFDYFKERNEEDIKKRYVNPNRMFFNSDLTDPRIDDEVRMIGEIIDTTLDDIVSIFARSPQEEDMIRGLYAISNPNDFMDYTGLTTREIDSLDFYMPSDSTKARMFEIWQLRSEWRLRVHDYADGSWQTVNMTEREAEAVNQQRIAYGTANGVAEDDIPLLDYEPVKEQFWYVQYLTPHGHSLFESETPYHHESHPYALHLYPLIDGEVWGFVEDIIDQQRYINRMIILLDFIMGASAKGVLIVPKDVIPSGMSPEEFAEDWREFDGVIAYEPKPHQQIPKQISANSSSVGISEMLQLQMQLIQDISGVHGAIQGKQSGSNTPASLYAQEAQNASTNTLDFFKSFNHFRRKMEQKALKLILQYYEDKRYFAIAGESDVRTMEYLKDKVRGKLFDLTLTHGVDTPAYKQLADETLMKLLEGQLIDVETYLENSSMPYSKGILESIKNKKREMQETGLMPGMEQEMQQLNADPRAMQMVQQGLR